MLVRIVKLTFRPEEVENFKRHFEQHKNSIIGFDGCSHLELLQDKNNPEIFFTYSYWENENYLNAYRNSPFFKVIWAQTKLLFNGKPEAWSLNSINKGCSKSP